MRPRKALWRLLHACAWLAAAQELYEVEFTGPLEADLSKDLEIEGFGRRGAFHPLARGGARVGDKIIAIDGKDLPAPGRPLTLPRRLRDATSTLTLPPPSLAPGEPFVATLFAQEAAASQASA